MRIEEKDMTTGKPGKKILLFALPLMLGNMFQQVYTLVDTAVVGQVVGVNALAALGSVDWFNWMSLGICSGLTQGFAILLAQHYGAKREQELKETMLLSFVLSVVSAVIITVLFEVAARPVLTLMGTGTEIIEDALVYVHIMFGGIIIVMTYNWLSSVLRAIGDSTTPLIAMAVASVCNIVLDLLFVAKFQWGIAGAAAATLIAQSVSCVYCFLHMRKIPILRICWAGFSLDGALTVLLYKLAAPMAMQNVIIAIGGMVLQSIVNSFGVIFVAGFTATNKLYGLIEIAAVSFGFAVCTYTGQNLGAEKMDRIRIGVKQGALMALVTSVLIGIAMLLFGQSILSIFVEKGNVNGAEVINYAYHYLATMSIFLPILYCLHIYRSALQGMGNTVIPLCSGMLELIMRIGAALFLPKLLGEYGIYLAEVAAWAGAAILLFVVYQLAITEKMRQQKEMNQ